MHKTFKGSCLRGRPTKDLLYLEDPKDFSLNGRPQKGLFFMEDLLKGLLYMVDL